METRDIGERASNAWALSLALLPAHTRGHRAVLTEALGNFPAPRPVPLTGEHSRQGELVPFQAGVADAGAPAEIRAHDFAIGDVLRGFTDDS